MAIFLLALTLAVVGDRIAEVDISTSVFRSVHLIDLLFPVFFVLTLNRLHVARKAVGGTLGTAALAWVGYCWSVGLVGHFITGLAGDIGAIAGMAFAAKELEFLTFLLFAAVVGYRRPDATRVVVGIACLILCLWLLKEIVRPSGIYYVGLPFEGGPSQTGAAYALTTVAAISFASASTGRAGRVAWGAAAVMLGVGTVLSLSRSALIGFAAALAILAFSAPRGAKVLMVSLIAVGGVSLAVLNVLEVEPEKWNLAIQRWYDVAEHAEVRMEKWQLLGRFLLDTPVLVLIGAGLGSPNYLVLGKEFGLLLAVDSGYVRRIFEVGIIGLALYLLLLWAIFRRGAALKCGTPIGALIAVLLGSAVALESFQVSQTALLFFGLAGAMIGRAAREQFSGRPYYGGESSGQKTRVSE